MSWYQGQGHLQRSRSDIRVKMGVSGALVFYKHILFRLCLPDSIFLALFEVREFVDDKLNVTHNIKSIFHREKHILIVSKVIIVW